MNSTQSRSERNHIPVSYTHLKDKQADSFIRTMLYKLQASDYLLYACLLYTSFMSRFCLFEGTWRKYHGLNDAETYLKECKRVSAEVLHTYPNVCDNYDDLFCSLDLSGVPGIILYKPYSNAENVVHAVSIGGTTATSFYNPTRDLVDSYLCSDGKPRWNSPLFLSDKDIYEEFSNRCLLYTS